MRLLRHNREAAFLRTPSKSIIIKILGINIIFSFPIGAVYVIFLAKEKANTWIGTA
jgi:hypothetical protein